VALIALASGNVLSRLVDTPTIAPAGVFLEIVFIEMYNLRFSVS